MWVFERLYKFKFVRMYEVVGELDDIKKFMLGIVLGREDWIVRGREEIWIGMKGVGGSRISVRGGDIMGMGSWLDGKWLNLGWRVV